LAVCAEIAQEFTDVNLDGARVSMQGFGNVGQHASRYLVERGAILTVATDIDGTIHNESGIDVDELVRCMRDGKGVTGYKDATKHERDAFVDIACDIFVPAAQPDVITEENADRVKCKLILQGANIPCRGNAERILHERGILSVPDFVANAGGVICGSVEYHGGTKNQAFSEIAEKMRENTRAVLRKSANDDILPREAALILARERVREAMSYRRSN
jgi:glutamate dehydrogenase/leucine dehydrogenase